MGRVDVIINGEKCAEREDDRRKGSAKRLKLPR